VRFKIILIVKMTKVAPTPVGRCFCGCGAEVPEDSFFSRGHDKAAEAMLTKMSFGVKDSVARRLAAGGYGPRAGDRNLSREFVKFQQAVEKGLALAQSAHGRRSRSSR
jgi:hypothetical protein